MNPDDVFRLIAGVFFLALVPFAAYHRVRAHSGEKLDRWQEGPFILFGLRLTALPWFVGSVAWMIDPAWMNWSSVPLPLWLRWCGVALFGIWAVLFVATFRHLGKNLTDTVVTRKEHTLVTSGPYRYVRHPFYLAYFVAVLGGSLVAANWFIFASGLVPCGFLIARTSIEEEKLIERFGDTYEEYMRQTGRFLPRL
jgi:protein-S-isoprenylcysteine O-methyltransferase Ste14